MQVVFGHWSFSLETEYFGEKAKLAETLAGKGIKRKKPKGRFPDLGS